MKLIVAIVRPEKLSDVLEALFHADVRGLTISRVQGHGGEIEHVENYRGTSVKMALADHPWYHSHFEREPLRLEKDEVVLPETPGFGIALDPAKVERQSPVEG